MLKNWKTEKLKSANAKDEIEKAVPWKTEIGKAESRNFKTKAEKKNTLTAEGAEITKEQRD